MGNHEWCCECEESEFHHYGECDPQKVIEVRKKRAEQERRRQAGTKKMRAALDAAGIKYNMDYEFPWLAIVRASDYYD